jgi:hypothetical protein
VAVAEAAEDRGLALDLDLAGGARVGERLDGDGAVGGEEVPREVHLGGRAAAQEAAELVPAQEHRPGDRVRRGGWDGAGGGRHRGGGVCSAGAVVVSGCDGGIFRSGLAGGEARERERDWWIARCLDR